VSASATVKDAISGAEFPLAQKFWEGETTRCLGATTRSKKIVFVNVKVYSVAAYVEAEKAAKELAIRERGGFFESDDDFCQALMDGAFNKVLVLRLLRDVEGQQFVDALNKHLVPRMQLAGEMSKLEQFMAYVGGKSLTNNTEVVMFWNVVGDMEVLVVPQAGDYATLKPELRVQSLALCRGLFETFMGSSSVVPEGRPLWAAGAKQLLESEQVKRNTRKGGSG